MDQVFGKMKTIKLAGIALGAVIFSGLGKTSGQEAATPPLEEKSPWERSAHLGATLTSGNSDTLLVTANVIGSRKWDEHELILGADAAYGEVEDVKNAETLHGFTQYNRLFSERFYGYARVDALHDDIAEVDYRLTIGPGAGYYFIKRKDDTAKTATSLSAEVGPSFIIEKVGGVTDEYLALRIGEKFEHRFSDKARVWQMAEFLPQVDDFENFIINAEIGTESSLTDRLSIKVFLQNTYDNQPAEDRKKNDLKLVSAVGYKF